MIDEDEESSDVLEDSKEDSANSSSSSDPGYPKSHSRSVVVHNDQTTNWGFDWIAFKASFLCSSALYNGVVIFNNSWRIEIVCEIQLWQSSWLNRDNTSYQQLVSLWTAVLQYMYTYYGLPCSYSITYFLNFQEQQTNFRILWAHSTPLTGQIQPILLVEEYHRHKKAIELATDDSPAERTAWYIVQEAIDSDSGCKRERNDSVTRFAVDLSEVLLSKNYN